MTEDLVEKARMAEHAERFEDMARFMKQVVEMVKGELSIEQRRLFCVAHKNIVGSRRNAWQLLSIEKATSDEEMKKLAKVYQDSIAKELHSICGEVLEIVDGILLPSAKTPESKVFFLKMAGDYHRYKAEVLKNEDKRDSVEKAEKCYQGAFDVAVTELPSTNIVRLGLALNFSVFYYEIMNNPDKACSLAKTAFDNSMAELDSLQEEPYKDSSFIMQLLRDNLALWTSSPEQGGGDELEKLNHDES